VVSNGLLNEFLMTRVPTDEFASTNGHARAQDNMNPVSRQSNLVIETNKPMTEEQLRKLLIKEAKAQDREFGLYFKEVTGGFTQTGRYSPNSFNVTPLEVYKIYVDGRPDELVRGVDLIGTPLSMFANIIEAGGEVEIFTGVCGAESGSVPVTAVSPKILVKKVEVQRKAKSSNTPPVLPRPDEQSKK
jgi:predicted Zn-dependent protease